MSDWTFDPMIQENRQITSKPIFAAKASSTLPIFQLPDNKHKSGQTSSIKGWGRNSASQTLSSMKIISPIKSKFEIKTTVFSYSQIQTFRRQSQGRDET